MNSITAQGRNGMLSCSKNKGVTLLEALITLAIAGILITAVAPNIQSILIGNKIASEVNSLSSAMRYARHTAINEQVTAVICPTTDFSSCGGDWNGNKMVFADINENNARDDNEELLISSDPSSKTINLSAAGNAFSFNADGSAANEAEFKFCPDNNKAIYARAILVTLYGKISVSNDSDDDGIAEGISGSGLACP